MNKDDIIRMAREVGINAEADTLCRYEGWVEPLEHFAALVSAAAKAEEREACAKVCEKHGSMARHAVWMAEECAAAIRARGQQ